VSGTIVSTDLFYEDDARRDDANGSAASGSWGALGALAVEMEAATLFALAANRGIAAGCVLLVSDLLRDGRRVRIDDQALAQASERIGQIAASALGAGRPSGR
jgi:uridine phosphorylase